MPNTQMRVQAYILLGQLLQRPTPELLELAKSDDFISFWQAIESSHGIKLPKSLTPQELPTLQDWDKMWNATMGPINPLAEPIESLYKIWTTDPSCEMTIASQKGYLKGDWGWHMEALLADASFEVPPQFAHCPDHLVIELEYASVIIEVGASAEAQATFAKHHFDWLDDLVETAKNKNAPDLYQDLYHLCAQFVKVDMESFAG